MITAAIAALVAFLFATLSEWLRERRVFRHRWDKNTYTLLAEYLGAARRLMHLAGDTAREDSDSDSLRDALMDLRMRCGQLLLLASPAVARHAVSVQSRAYELVRAQSTGVDPRPDGRSPMTRLYAAVGDLVTAARGQLALPAIDGIQRDNLPAEFKTYADQSEDTSAR